MHGVQFGKEEGEVREGCSPSSKELAKTEGEKTGIVRGGKHFFRKGADTQPVVCTCRSTDCPNYLGIKCATISIRGHMTRRCPALEPRKGGPCQIVFTRPTLCRSKDDFASRTMRQVLRGGNIRKINKR